MRIVLLSDDKHDGDTNDREKIIPGKVAPWNLRVKCSWMLESRQVWLPRETGSIFTDLLGATEKRLSLIDMNIYHSLEMTRNRCFLMLRFLESLWLKGDAGLFRVVQRSNVFDEVLSRDHSKSILRSLHCSICKTLPGISFKNLLVTLSGRSGSITK